MQDYDVTLKTLLRGSAEKLFEDLTGAVVAKWLDIELPKVQNPRMDLLAETADGAIAQLELQSSNDSEMPLRMAEYYLGVYRQFERFPQQTVLYVGEAALRMLSQLEGPRFSFSYELVDIRDLDSERLLNSQHVGDNVIGILTRLGDQRRAIHKIIGNIASLEASERETALKQLMILSGLRGLEEVLEEEIRKMPILNDIMDHKVLGREYKRGASEEALTILRRLIEERFGAIPASAEERFNNLPTTELEILSVRVLKAKDLEDLLK